MKTEQKETNKLLGFLGFYETQEHDGYLGTILITNMQGVPQEFRCTHPVKPTMIQKPLYGNTLEPYIGITLCSIPLIESIQNKPALIIVQKEFLLDIRPTNPCPVIFIRRAGEVMEIKTPETKLKRERVDCSTGRFQPIICSPHPEFEEDLHSARELLERIFTHFDPLEPFERMSKAIETLAKQDERFR